jgi:hypothetical protein
MPHPPRHDRQGQRPSDRTPPPADVTDRLLWALAVDVAAAHQPGPDGSCANLQCRGQRGPCRAPNTARRAAQLLRRAATNGPTSAPVAPQTPPPLPRRVARGRATVTAAPDRSTNWFGANAVPATPTPAASAPSALPATFAPFRRPPVAALAA